MTRRLAARSDLLPPGSVSLIRMRSSSLPSAALPLFLTCLIPGLPGQAPPAQPPVMPAQAGWTANAPSPAQVEADQFTRGVRLRPGKVSQALARVTRELNWHKTLPAAVREAKLTGKPIVWVQAFGELKGFT